MPVSIEENAVEEVLSLGVEVPMLHWENGGFITNHNGDEIDIMQCIYEMYDQIFHWVLLGNYGGFVSKWEGYPQFQWQFQWATLIKMLGRDMDPLRLVFLFFFML
jgi:hypothetical protein